MAATYPACGRRSIREGLAHVRRSRDAAPRADAAVPPVALETPGRTMLARGELR